jgi:hypothetical protein
MTKEARSQQSESFHDRRSRFVIQLSGTGPFLRRSDFGIRHSTLVL